MKTFAFLLSAILAGVASAFAQPNVHAHYANGQVWVVWDVQDVVRSNCVPTLTPALSNGVPVIISNCLPATYAIYWSQNPVTNTTTAMLVGRLFAQEWSGFILRDNVNASFGFRPTGFRIPDGAGGYRVLETNQGVFVHTVRSNFSGHYAVRPFGVTNVQAAWRAPLTNAVFSLADPPTCHLQANGANQGYPVEWWTMWADGDTDLAAARPDYPIMENDKRRGIPHNFSICSPAIGGLPATNVPVCVAFHSGDGQAKMWLPENNGFKSIGLSPIGGLLVAVEDRFFSINNGVVDAGSIASTGYVPSFDPFFDHQHGIVFASPPGKLPGPNEIIFPYPLYRLNWTLDWLYVHKSVDSNRVALVGHSGGAKGSLLWSHASPERFAYVGLYNPALGQFPAGEPEHVGTLAQNLPLRLTNHLGQLVRATEIHEFTASYSLLRDLPFTRIFHGKREENWVLDDNRDAVADVGAIYRESDAWGLGAAVFWDLRRHGMDTWTFLTLSNDIAHPNPCPMNPTVDLTATWGIEDLWIPTLNTQFRRDDATNQIRHRADRSYPAFFNCALRGGHEDPGSVIYTNNSFFYQDNFPYDGLVTTTECRPPWTGSARGTFGGYCDWETNVVDTTTNWSAVLFLVGAPSAFNPVEICPDAVRVVDVAIRRPQQFKPMTGAPVTWELRNAANNGLLQSGTNVVGPDDLVSIPSLGIPRDPLRARLSLAVPPPALPADFGDAPAPYPTRLGQSGARHTSPNTVFLGAAVDTEPDGQPGPNALGDDNLATDDEDGVAPAGPMVAGHTAKINVTASGAGLLDAFVDFNADGDWTDAGEQIFTSQPVVAGLSLLMFPVPPNAVVGQTFARFRLSIAGGLSSTGAVANGEVEDYRVLIRAPVSSNLFAGLRYSSEGGARASVATNGTLFVSNVVAQSNSGISLELGRASGLQLQTAMQRENTMFFSGVSTRVRGLQGGRSKDLARIMWEGPALDGSKNEVAIESIELVHEGLTVRHFDAQGRALFAKFIDRNGAFRGIWSSPNAGGDQPMHELGHVGFISDTALFADSPAGRGLHFGVTFPGIVSPRDPASGLPTGQRVTMPDGQIIDGVAFSVFSYEALTQPVEALERVEILGVGGTEWFAVADAGLFQGGLRLSGGPGTRLGGFLENATPGFYAVPEVDDEVLIRAGGSDFSIGVFPSTLLTEFGIPALDAFGPDTELSLESVRTFTRPANPGVIESISTKYTMFLSSGAHFVFKGELVGVEPFHQLEIFNRGMLVASSVFDRHLNMTIAGPGRPVRVRPGIPRAGENSVETGIAFDTPMTITIGDASYVGDELSFRVEIEFPEHVLSESQFASLRLRSPGQTEYRFTPEEPWDWGDLPTPYLTTAAQNGARHRMVPGLRLGRSVDPESNGRPCPTAAGDDRWLNDDEDGVIFTSALVPGTRGSKVNVNVVAPSAGAFIDAFVDWDGNGNIEDIGEKFLDRRRVINGLNTLTFDVPAGARSGRTYARFRLSFDGGLDCEGPAHSGEVEDYVIRILSNAPPTHPSGLALVPRGGAELRLGTGGALEINGLTDGGDDGVSLVASSNVVSRGAGRILLPLNPPIPVSAFTSVTRPFADGLVLEAHYFGANEQFWTPQLKLIGGDSGRPIIVGAIFGGTDRDGGFLRRVRICGFGADSHVGSSFADSGDVGSFSGSANLVRLGWATFPPSALVIFDGNATFTGADGAVLTGNSFRFVSMDNKEGQESVSLMNFTGLSIHAPSLGAGLLGFSDLRVRNPLAPMIQSLNLHPSGGATLNFPTEPDTFYSLEATDALTSPRWTSPTAVYQFGNGGVGTLSDPQAGSTKAFYRLRLE